ncbi:PREDICTED: TATA box-binding protein-associated factor RNA polymerase I subunit B [Nicrophorus vespilloides]|uniref:TATA box-binding protein-associated factor RNA polymerase I subunit B n=1 Tax=Nicrophorus vespilloides TaxID=110193 RepID=A0ABM1M4U2_NICVS|nr:PREDICTED: TATA box-binding protein-associated factor RNA polymerase I subunit B [Nicrophorus vespilloides]
MATVCQTCGTSVFRIFEGKSICSVCNTEVEDFVSRENEIESETRARKIASGTTNENRFTSWEFYNRIMLGLTNELIILGADTKLKDVMQRIWFMYLKKKEVVSEDPDALPKLPFNYKNLDAEIIYGLKKKKRVIDHDKLLLNESNEEDIIRAKKKRFRKLAVNEAFNESQRDEVDWSMMNQTIADLRTDEDKIPMQVNQVDYDMLLEHMTKDHLEEHLEDLDNKMTCHNLKLKDIQSCKRFLKSHLSKNILYQLLYIGLMIVKSDIQCGDMLRFIVNGHMSYNNIGHLLTEEMVTSQKNYRWLRDTTPVKREFLTKCWALVDYIKVREYIPIQNLPALCKRYCKELNLPNEIQRMALNLMAESRPRFNGNSKDYEARAMCFIVFTLKMLFSFDSITEYKFSEFADLLDDKCKMFNIIKWLEFIKCRRKLLAMYHLPTQLAKSTDDINHNNLIEMLESCPPVKANTTKTWEQSKMLSIIETLKSQINRKRRSPKFEPTLTPLQHYTEQILDTGNVDETYLLNVLQQDFTWFSLDYLTNTEKYAKVKLNMRNANDNIEFVPILVKRVPPTRATVDCMIVDGETPQGQDFRFLNKKPLVAKIKKNRSAYYMPEMDKMIGKDAESFPSYKEHYAPEKRFWLLLGHKIDQKESLAEEYFKNLPYNFRTILEECASMLQTTLSNFCQEYVYFESYICYSFKPERTKILTTHGNKLHFNTTNQHARDYW